MPKFKPNTSSAMKKKTPYKMKGYSYPGTSPVKNKDGEEKVKTKITINEQGEEILTKSKGNKSADYKKDPRYSKKSGGKGTKWVNINNPNASFITTT
jgi:hypothetical protein